MGMLGPRIVFLAYVCLARARAKMMLIVVVYIQIASPPMSPTFSAGPIAYPTLSRPALSGQSSFNGGGAVSPPPLASINASPLAGARRRSEVRLCISL